MCYVSDILEDSGNLSRNNSVRVSSSSSALRSNSADMAEQPNTALKSPSVTAHRPDVLQIRDAKHFVQQPQQQQQRIDGPKANEPSSPSKPQKQFGSKRLVALAAALDAGELFIVCSMSVLTTTTY